MPRESERGGARAGAGRKPIDGPIREVVTIRMLDDERGRFENAARLAGYVKQAKGELRVQLSPWMIAAAELAAVESSLTAQQAAAFRRAADAEGLSLAAWMIAAGELAVARGSTR